MENRSLAARTVKKMIHVIGRVQFPMKVGEAACYWNGEHFVFTDKVKRILEVSPNYARFETTAYIYTIETNLKECGQRRMVA